MRAKSRQCDQYDVVADHLEKAAQALARVASAEAVSAECRVPSAECRVPSAVNAPPACSALGADIVDRRDHWLDARRGTTYVTSSSAR